MAEYVGRMLTALSSALEFNTATLSGAIDVVVIEDERGRRQSSPFHVRFGKLQLLRTRGLPVTVELNSRQTNLRLYLGPAGEAYFYHPPDAEVLVRPRTSACVDTSSNAHHPQNQLNPPAPNEPPPSASSPTFEETFEESISRDRDVFGEGLAGAMTRSESLPNPPPHMLLRPNMSRVCPPDDAGAGYVSDSEVEMSRLAREGTAEVVLEPRSPPVTNADRRYLKAYPRCRGLRDNQLGPCAELAGSPELPSGSSRERPASVTATTSTAVESGENAPLQDMFVGDKDGSGDTRLFSPLTEENGSAVECGTSQPAHSLREYPKMQDDSRGATLVEEGRSRDTNVSCVEMQELHSVTVSADAESEAIVAEDAKLEVRSLGGYDEEEVAGGHDRDDAAEPGRCSVDPERLSSALTNALEPGASERSSGSNVATRKLGSFAGDSSEISDGLCVSMSRCGNAVRPEMSEDEIRKLVDKHRVSECEFTADPNILFHPDMLFCIDDRLVEFRIAAPFVMFKLAFGKSLDIDHLSSKMMPPGNISPPDGGSHSATAACPATQESRQQKKPRSKTSGGLGTWFGWSRSTPEVVGEPLLNDEDWEVAGPRGDSDSKIEANDEGKPNISSEERAKSALNGCREMPDAPDGARVMTGSKAEDSAAGSAEHSDIPIVSSSEAFAEHEDEKCVECSVGSPPTENNPTQSSRWDALDAAAMAEMEDMLGEVSERLTLVPTSEQLAELDLHPGANTLRFVVEPSLAEVSCRVFLWKSDVKIVVSDVDGTITRSDVLGHILPVVGRDWSHVGVAALYSEVAKNGYKIVYLTARPIGQASRTRDFLHSVVQGGARLPNGPVLMSPNRLVESLTREVIRRKPQEFKIACLRELRSLFPMDYNPFHAGFGNRETDVISYRAVGILPHRIFVVDTTSELAVNSVRYESASSYSSLMALVTSVFPDIRGQVGHELVRGVTDGAEFNSWNFWRPALPDIDLDKLLADDSSA